MTNKRFVTRHFGNGQGNQFVPSSVGIIAIPPEAWEKLDPLERDKAIIVRIRLGGMISVQLAETWAIQLCEQLNQFDIANATVAKIT